MSETPSRSGSIAAFAVTVFLSAFLLFQVQPLLSKAILPWFGGTPSVWTTCMLFFQSLLFGGYAYAHLLAGRIAPRGQFVIHSLLIAVALFCLPVAPSADWKPDGSDQPTLHILLLLGVSVGVPFFVLSSTGPLLQSWFARRYPGASPYRLYALSNAGSLLALVSYPFLFEPAFDVAAQSLYWSIGFGAFGLLCVYCAWSAVWNADPAGAVSRTVTPSGGQVPAEAHGTETSPTPGTCLMWFALSMAGSALLLATTNQVCLDVAAVPFLWVMPLSLYLLTFILCFESDRWYSPKWALPMMVVSIAGMCRMMMKKDDVSLTSEIAIYFAGMFFCTMVCHGELSSLKPPAKHLTAFYLVISAGGAAGGLFVGIVAPLVFPAYFELHLALFGVATLMLVALFRDTGGLLHGGKRLPVWLVLITANAGLAAFLANDADEKLAGATETARNFYGVLRVTERSEDNPKWHRMTLMHGRIQHGMQYLSDEKRRRPTTYYGHDSAAGIVLDNLRPNQPKHVGVVGLGVGTIASYAKPGDRYRYYEINPIVVRMAKTHFTYLKDCKGDLDVVVGDARLMLEREEPQQFDVLVLDAFSSDAIPAHLLTVEAFHVYKRHLKPDGVLVVHISNLYFNLMPVVTAAAEKIDFQYLQVGTNGDTDAGISATNWVAFARDFSGPEFEPLRKAAYDPTTRRILWTDSFSNLMQVLKKKKKKDEDEAKDE